MVSRLLDTQHNPVACPCKDSSFLVNASVIINYSQPYNNIETHVAIKIQILRFSFGFCDLSIDLGLTNAAHARPN